MLNGKTVKVAGNNWFGKGILLCLLLWAHTSAAEAVKVQLRWYHQFQFAGYYMALEQGYYQKAGIDVQLIEGKPGKPALEELLSGRVQLAVSGSGAMLAYLQGQPVVALAAVFQKSPSAWIVRGDSTIYTLQDLANKRLEMMSSIDNAELLAVFAQEGINLNRLKIVSTSMSLDNLLADKTDAFHGYLSNEPFLLEKLGVPYRVIQPAEYGVNFYQDLLVANQQWVEDNPDLAEAFTIASMDGWRYALNNIEETISVIRQKYAPEKSVEHLRYEARVIQSLVMPDLVGIGHMNPGRWQQIANTYVELGMAPEVKPLDDFIFKKAQPVDYAVLTKPALLALAIVLVLGYFTLRFRRLAAALRCEVARHAATEQQLVQRNLELLQLASTDILTGLSNRRVIMQQAQAEIRRAARYQKDLAVLMLDVDHFKQINDRYGHAAGDQVLSEFASLCRQSIRDTDLAGRYGGEEFFILLPELDLKTAILSAERIRMAIADHSFRLSDGRVLGVTCSIGIAMYRPEQDDLDQLLLRADQALYQAKNQGRNRCCVQPTEGVGCYSY